MSIERAIGEGMEATEFVRDDPPALPSHVKHDQRSNFDRPRSPQAGFPRGGHLAYQNRPVQYSGQVPNASYARAASGPTHANVNSVSAFPTLDKDHYPTYRNGYDRDARQHQYQYNVPVDNRFDIFEDYTDY